jgi:rhodanese-related sulfurtransferase
MDIVLWVVALLALVVAHAARKRALALEEKLNEVRRSGSGAAAGVEQLGEKLDTIKAQLGRLAGGQPMDSSMVRDGRLFGLSKVADVQADFDAGDQPYVIDVRTVQEWSGGHIPGAVHMPMEEMQKSLHSMKRDGTKMYVICAGGGRSSAAAEFISNRGFLNVWNVDGGMKTWRGEMAKD